MSQLYVVVLAIIATVLLAVALYRTTRVKTKADYLVAGRSLPAFVLVLTLLTSWIGAGSLFAGAENAYKNGFAALWQPAGGWLGLLLIYFIAPRARKFAQFTLPDLLEARYNQTARVLGTFAILFAYVGITSYQFKGGGDVLHLIFPDTVSSRTRHLHHRRLRHRHHRPGRHVLGGLHGCGHRLAGHRHLRHRRALSISPGRRLGRSAFRAAAAVFRSAWQLPLSSAVLNNPLPWVCACLEFLVPTMLLMLGNQVMYQKFFSAKSEKDARISVVGWIIGTLLLETLIVAIAVFGSRALSQRAKSHCHPREIIPYTARHGLPAVLGRAPARRRLRQGHLHRLELPLLPRHQSRQRRLRPLHRARRVKQARAHHLAARRGAARLLGALPGRLRRKHSAEDALGLHHLLRRAHAGRARRLLLQTRHRLGSSRRYRRRAPWSPLPGICPQSKALFPHILADRDAIFPALFVAVAALIVVSLFTAPPEPSQLAQFAE